jgi:hypothetical protein
MAVMAYEKEGLPIHLSKKWEGLLFSFFVGFVTYLVRNMIRLMVIAFSLSLFLNTSIAQVKQKKSEVRSKNVVSKPLNIIKINQVGSESVGFQYSLSSEEFALLISTSLEAEKNVVIEAKNTVVSDTVIFPLLKSVGKAGMLVASRFKSRVGNLGIKGLEPRKDYFLNLYKAKSRGNDTFQLVKTYGFNTLAREPEVQSYQLAFESVTDNSFVLTFVNGNGEGRIVVIAEGENIDLPENGKQYKASPTYGTESTRIGKSFVVYDGKEVRPRVAVEGLKPATKYVVAVFEYNGEGKYRHYNTTSALNNQRTTTTKIPAPKILKVVATSSETYLVKWEKVVGATTYILDLALDETFQNRVEPFVDLDVGNLGEFELSELVTKKTYYLRIKAKGPSGESLYSSVFKFKAD